MTSAILTMNLVHVVDHHPLMRTVLISSRRRPHGTHVIVVHGPAYALTGKNFHVKVKRAKWTVNQLTKRTTMLMTNQTLNHSLDRLSTPVCTTRLTHVTFVTTPSTHPTLILRHVLTRTAESQPRLRPDRFKYVSDDTEVYQA